MRTRRLSIPEPKRRAGALPLWCGVSAGFVLFANLWLMLPSAVGVMSRIDLGSIRWTVQSVAAIAAWPRGEIQVATAVEMLRPAHAERYEQEATSLLRRGLGTSPANAAGWQIYAEHLFQARQVEQSLAALSMSFMLAPNEPEKMLDRLTLASRLCGSPDDDAAAIIKHHARAIVLKRPQHRRALADLRSVASPVAWRLIAEVLDLR